MAAVTPSLKYSRHNLIETEDGWLNDPFQTFRNYLYSRKNNTVRKITIYINLFNFFLDTLQFRDNCLGGLTRNNMVIMWLMSVFKFVFLACFSNVALYRYRISRLFSFRFFINKSTHSGRIPRDPHEFRFHLFWKG